jgi:hypothetical protein
MSERIMLAGISNAARLLLHSVIFKAILILFLPFRNRSLIGKTLQLFVNSRGNMIPWKRDWEECRQLRTKGASLEEVVVVEHSVEVGVAPCLWNFENLGFD